MPDAPAALTTPTPAATPPKSSGFFGDRFGKQMLEDLGKVLDGDGNLKEAPPKAPEPKPDIEPPTIGMTIGELLRNKAEKEEVEKSKVETPTPPAEKKEETPVAPPATTETPPVPQKKKVEVSKEPPLEKLVEGIVSRLQANVAPEAKPDHSEKTAIEQQNEDLEAGLDDLQRDELELARFAAETNPGKYKDMPKKLVQYIKKTDELIASKQKEDPDWNPESDESFAKFVADNKPEYDGADRRRLERDQIKKAALQEAENALKPRLEETERRQRAIELKPEVDAAVSSYRKRIAENLPSDNDSPLAAVAAKVKEAGWEAAMADKPLRLRASIAKTYTDRAVALGQEYLELTSGIRTFSRFDPNQPLDTPTNSAAQRQAALMNFIAQQENYFKLNGGNAKVQNGKTFLPQREFFALPKEKQSEHWTTDSNQVLDMLEAAASQNAIAAINAEEERLKSLGYELEFKKEKSKTEEKTSEKRVESQSPKAPTTPSPGSGSSTPAPSGNKLFSDNEFKALTSDSRKYWTR